MKKSIQAIVWGGFFATAAISSLVQANEIEIRDAFERSSSGSAVTLQGLSIGSGLDWEADRCLTLVQSDGEKYVAYNSTERGLAKFRIPNSAKKIRIDAKLRPTKPADKKASWIAVGMGNPKAKSSEWSFGVFMLINTDGAIQCMYDAGEKMSSFKGGKPKGFSAEQYNTMGIEYDKERGTVSFFVNGRPVLEDVSLSDLRTDMDLSYAGFCGWGQEPMQKSVGSFSIKITE